MNQRKECICGKSYWTKQAWVHENCAQTVGQVGGREGVDRATKAADVDLGRDHPDLELARGSELARQPFDRVAYQREYMKVWLALKSGRACLWPKKEGL